MWHSAVPEVVELAEGSRSAAALARRSASEVEDGAVIPASAEHLGELAGRPPRTRAELAHLLSYCVWRAAVHMGAPTPADLASLASLARAATGAMDAPRPGIGDVSALGDEELAAEIDRLTASASAAPAAEAGGADEDHEV